MLPCFPTAPKQTPNFFWPLLSYNGNHILRAEWLQSSENEGWGGPQGTLIDRPAGYTNGEFQ